MRPLNEAPDKDWFLGFRFGRWVMCRRSKDPEYTVEFFDPEHADSKELRFNACNDITEWHPLPEPPK